MSLTERRRFAKRSRLILSLLGVACCVFLYKIDRVAGHDNDTSVATPSVSIRPTAQRNPTDPTHAQALPTRVVADQTKNAIRFFVANKEMAFLDGHGLHVEGPIEYEGDLTETIVGTNKGSSVAP